MLDHIQFFDDPDEIVKMSVQDYYDEYTRLIHRFNKYHHSIIYLNSQSRDVRVRLWNNHINHQSHNLVIFTPSHQLVPDWIRQSLPCSSIVQLLEQFNFLLWKSYVISIFSRSRAELMRASLIILSEPSIRKWINKSPQSDIQELIDDIVNIPNSIINDINIHLNKRVDEFFNDVIPFIKPTDEFESESLIHYISSLQNINNQLVNRIIQCMDRINMRLIKIKSDIQ